MALVAETLRTDARVLEEHTAAGVSFGSLFRAAASVWDTVDRLNKCRRLGASSGFGIGAMGREVAVEGI